jgi:hypothetical protein
MQEQLSAMREFTSRLDVTDFRGRYLLFLVFAESLQIIVITESGEKLALHSRHAVNMSI